MTNVGPLCCDTVCDTCGDYSNSDPGLVCGRVDDDEPDAVPCTGTYQLLDHQPTD